MFLDISSWWQSMAAFEKILWAIAIVFSALFIVQAIVSAGSGDEGTAHGDADHYIGDDPGIGYQFFTIKNFIAFFTMFGWVGIAAYKGGLGPGITLVAALVGGIAMIVIMALLFRNVSRLRHSGTLDINNALNVVGEAYLFIPARRSGTGKVHIKVQGSLRELQALTDDISDIPSGKLVKVTGVLNEKILLVTAIS
jgi:membrane protein implicated in regulation of membrane protease activity